MSSAIDSYMRIPEFHSQMTAAQVTEMVDAFSEDPDSDMRTVLTGLTEHIRSLLGDAGELVSDYAYDGYDQLNRSESGLTDEQRDLAITAMETVAHNIGAFVAELRRRAAAVSRRPGWDPLKNPLSC